MSGTLAAEPPQVWVSAIAGGFCDFDGHAMRAAKALRPPAGADSLDRFDDEVLPPGFPESKQNSLDRKPAFGCDEVSDTQAAGRNADRSSSSKRVAVRWSV